MSLSVQFDVSIYDLLLQNTDDANLVKSIC